MGILRINIMIIYLHFKSKLTFKERKVENVCRVNSHKQLTLLPIFEALTRWGMLF